MTASNRQKKILRFFGIDFADNITSGAAGWEIGSIFHDPNNELAWNKYLYLTNDFCRDSDQLATFDRLELESTELPVDWDSSDAASEIKRATNNQTFRLHVAHCPDFMCSCQA